MIPGMTVNLGAYIRPPPAPAPAAYSGPAFSVAYTGIASSTSISSVTISTVPIGGVVVLFSGSEGTTTSPSVSSISGLGLTWQLRKRQSNVGQGGGVNWIEVWYAINNTGSAISASTITITYGIAFDDQAAVAAIFTGCNITNPWSSIASVSSAGAAGTAPTALLSTDRANALGIVAMGSSYANLFAVPTGWTSIANATNSGATYWEYVITASRGFTTQQTNLSVASSTVAASAGWSMIVDSLVA